MKSYTCYVYIRDLDAPQLTFVQAENRFGLLSAMTSLIQKWPQYVKIDVHDDADLIVASYVQPDHDARVRRL